MSSFLTKESILQSADRPVISVEVPEWGGQVYVRTLGGAERDQFEAGCAVGGAINLDNFRARLCVLAIADEHGNRLFTDADAPTLGEKAGKPLDRIYEAARKHNGMAPESVETLAKN